MQQLLKFPVMNLFLKGTDLVQISEVLSIGKIPGDESDFLSGIRVHKRGSDNRLLADLRFAIECKIETEDAHRSPPQIEEDQWKIANDLLLALRLFKEGALGLSFAYVFHGAILSVYEEYPLRVPWIGEWFELGYTLDKLEEQNFLQLFKKLQASLTVKQQLEASTQLFNKAFDATTWDDKLIQCMASFESLVLSFQERYATKKGQLIGERVGELLGATQQEKLAIGNNLRKAYHFRSIMVHGDLAELDKYTLEDKIKLCHVAENCLRRALRTHIKA